ncbi:MAG: hypothetical protein ACAI35_15790 [Candidatus Methylacidiphilales bacterium]|nr:hypothetical protein [Candidatus Methylacidiphilales bacterium]
MKNVIILVSGLGIFVACALGGLYVFVQNNKGLNRGMANLMLTKNTGTSSSSTSSGTSRLSNLNDREQETVGEWAAVYTKTDKFESKFEENFYEDKTFRMEMRHIEKDPIGNGVRGEVTIEIKFLARGSWYCKGDRIYLKINSIPILHVNNIKIDAPDIANTQGTGYIENIRQEAINDVQQAVNEKKEWLMKQRWYIDIISSDGETIVCRDRTGETLYRHKVIKEQQQPAKK